MVPVGASTVACELRTPWISPAPPRRPRRVAGVEQVLGHRLRSDRVSVTATRQQPRLDSDEQLGVPQDLLDAARRAWERRGGARRDHGVRNSQATVLAPTGTIGLMMDCDTTAIEPDLALTRQEAQRRRNDVHRQPDDPACAFEPRLQRGAEVDVIVAYIDEHKTIIVHRAAGQSTLPCSPARWATTRSTTWGMC